MLDKVPSTVQMYDIKVSNQLSGASPHVFSVL